MQAWWQILMDSEARREHPGDITLELSGSVPPRERSLKLVYRHRGLRVRGLGRRVPVEVQFWEKPYYNTFGLPALDYPRYFADPGAKSKHRMPDDSLCMWFPPDPPEKRWLHTDGLAMLLRLTANHLLCEAAWRQTAPTSATRGGSPPKRHTGCPARPAGHVGSGSCDETGPHERTPPGPVRPRKLRLGVFGALVAGVIAGVFVLLGLLASSARARLDTRKGVYAEAIRAVSDDLEGPYRVARCHNDADQRFALSKDLSEIQGRIDAHLVLVELHAPRDVF